MQDCERGAMYCDSHAHLESDRFAADREHVIARAREAGVRCIITCGSDLETSEQAVRLAWQYEGVYAAVGIHAHRAASVARSAQGGWAINEAAMRRLADLARQPRVVAIGEIGLDYHYDFSPREAQRAVFGRQLALAAELGLPVILHSREAKGDFRSLIEAAPQVRGVWHCFLAEGSFAEWALARGLYLGIAGPISFKNAAYLGEIVRNAPLDRLLIETDSPYLAPHPMRGRRNEPAYVVYVAEHVGKWRGLSGAEIGEITFANARNLFGVRADGC